MKQLTMIEPDRVEWLDAPEPAIEGAQQALVRPLAVALCDLDLAIIRGEYPLQPPVPLGHEFVAEVVEIGDAVLSTSPGDRVIVRGEATGTPVGELFGARPTGRSFKTMALDVFTVRGDKLASAYHVENWVGAIQQMQREVPA